MLNMCELFLSIEGEGRRAGLPCTFIRRSGCNCRCSYCDTEYSFDEGCAVSVDDLISKVDKVSNGCKCVTLTGGEPLYCPTSDIRNDTIQLLKVLSDRGYEVNIETNGSVDLSDWVPFVKPNGFFTMDWKSISSGMSGRMIESNLDILDEQDVLKFVVANEEDLSQMLDIVQNRDIKAQIYVSPVFNRIKPAEIVKFLLDNKLYEVRSQIQLHKVIWDPDTRGV